MLSDSTFKASPFYPGKTMYGGASAYRSRRLPVRSSHQVPLMLPLPFLQIGRNLRNMHALDANESERLKRFSLLSL